MSTRGGKYLTFGLGDEGYGVPIGRVRSIIGYVPVTAVPCTPAYVRGVINLRGQVLPVIDLRVRLGLAAAGPTNETCVIVVESPRPGGLTLHGLIVDKVCEVPHVPEETVADAPPLGAGVDTRFILGLAKVGGGVRILLDVDHVLAGEERRAAA
jgi:purine-binding chemotaxis protein CheW